eukprot:1156734-Pelagomonas_calceolata.AAC.3
MFVPGCASPVGTQDKGACGTECGTGCGMDVGAHHGVGGAVAERVGLCACVDLGDDLGCCWGRWACRGAVMGRGVPAEWTTKARGFLGAWSSACAKKETKKV